MSKAALRVYGTLFDVPLSMFEALKDRFGFDVETWNDGKYELEFEGNWCDVEGLAEALPSHITLQTEGKIDAIDQHDWTLTRIVVKDGRISSRTISCDDPLERYRLE